MTFSGNQLPLDLVPEVPTYAGQDFIRGPSNEEAFQAMMALNDPNSSSFGLVIVGPAGSGKTHLAHLWQTMTNALFVSPSRCLEEAEFYRSLPKAKKSFILDDFPASGSEVDLFHFYNFVKEEEGKLLILSRALPREWPFLLPDLKSRLLSLPCYRLNSPDDSLLRAVLRKCFSDFQIRVPENVISYLLPRIERSFKAVQDFAYRLNQEALTRKKNITLKMVRACLEEGES